MSTFVYFKRGVAASAGTSPFGLAQSNVQSSGGGSGGGSGTFDEPLTFNGAFAGTPTYTSDTSREDYYHYQANSNNGGTGSAYTSSSTNATNDAITNLHTDGWGADPGTSYSGSGTATSDTYNSGGSVIDWQSASSAPEAGDDTRISVTTNHMGGSPDPEILPPTAGVPDLFYSSGYWTGFGGPGPAPGNWVYVYAIDPLVPTTGGVDLPRGEVVGGGDPTETIPAPAAGRDGSPVLSGSTMEPGGAAMSDVPTQPAALMFPMVETPATPNPGVAPAPRCRASWAPAQVASLPSLALTPSRVDAVFGMGYVADAGYGGTGSTYFGDFMPPVTRLAEGNLAAVASASFVSDTMPVAARRIRLRDGSLRAADYRCGKRCRFRRPGRIGWYGRRTRGRPGRIRLV